MEKGGLAILSAMRSNTRLRSLNISFGNKISLKTTMRIEQEVKANDFIENYVKPSLKNS